MVYGHHMVLALTRHQKLLDMRQQQMNRKPAATMQLAWCTPQEPAAGKTCSGNCLSSACMLGAWASAWLGTRTLTEAQSWDEGRPPYLQTEGWR